MGGDRKRKNLIRLGVEQGMAYAWNECNEPVGQMSSGHLMKRTASGWDARMGGWRVAQSPILGTTITINRLKQRGYISFMEYYHKVRHR